MFLTWLKLSPHHAHYSPLGNKSLVPGQSHCPHNMDPILKGYTNLPYTAVLQGLLWGRADRGVNTVSVQRV